MSKLKCIVICAVFLSAILGAHTKHHKQSKVCSKRKPPKNRTPTDFKVYEKTYTVIADGHGFLATRAEPWPESWQNFWSEFGSSAVKYGREVIGWMKDRYGFNASAITDGQLENGEDVELGDFKFRPMVFDANTLNSRILAETTEDRARMYRNTTIAMASYMFQAKESYTSTGKVDITIPPGGFVFKGGYIFYPDAECGSSDAPEFITFVSKQFYIIDENGFAPMDCDLFSEKYGEGNQIGIDVFSSFLSPPVTYRHASVIFFPRNIGGQ